MLVRVCVSVLLVAVMAGCFGGADEATTPSPTSTAPQVVPVFDFDGRGAYDYVVGLVTENGTDRYRVPGTPGHASAANWLQETMAMPGWTVERITFTGQDYQALEKQGSVRTYATDPRFCLERDQRDLENATFHNLVARYDGGEKTLLMGAHWDSKEEASQETGESYHENSVKPVLGANDGASGVGVLLQFMAHVAAGDLQPAFDVEIVFFDGEDGFEDCHPLAGSLYHAHTQPLPDRMLLLDMVGDRDARFVREAQSVQSDPGFVDLLWHHGERTGLAENLVQGAFGSVIDDHVPFIQQGGRGVDIIDYGRNDTSTGFPPYWHTRGDTMENIDAGMLGRVGSMVATTIQDPEFIQTL